MESLTVKVVYEKTWAGRVPSAALREAITYLTREKDTFTKKEVLEILDLKQADKVEKPLSRFIASREISLVRKGTGDTSVYRNNRKSKS